MMPKHQPNNKRPAGCFSAYASGVSALNPIIDPSAISLNSKKSYGGICKSRGIDQQFQNFLIQEQLIIVVLKSLLMRQFNIFIFPAVPGYGEFISDSTERCADPAGNFINKPKGNRFTVKALESCMDLCDSETECQFFFLSKAGWCALFKNCVDRETNPAIGTTYKKIIKGLC